MSSNMKPYIDFSTWRQLPFYTLTKFLVYKYLFVVFANIHAQVYGSTPI